VVLHHPEGDPRGADPLDLEPRGVLLLTADKASGTLHRTEFLDRALRAAAEREMGRLETGLTFLASVGSTAPFVWLFGTIWGIFHALVRIGATGETSLDQVAGPVGEALIMTALGLAVAVPAVLGYNLLVRNNRVIIAGFHAFAEDLLAHKIKIDLPQASTVLLEEKHDTITITIAIMADGRMFLNDAPTDRENMVKRLSAEAQRKPQPDLHLHVDRTPQFQQLAAVMADAQNAGMVKVAIATDPLKGDALP
jgi:biopolymer transport protein ExbD